ncbi:TatD family hydrolase [Glaciecola sp. SC05]|uniref:TatD family hydrolase n=1 Tax=Glaciecola sp. SC05 TaxID=1987355 RepID=UPI0035283964
MIDSHCHIDLPAFDEDRAQVIEKALSKGVKRILVPGLGINQVDRLLALKARFKTLDIAAGFHPYFLCELRAEEWREQLAIMAKWVDTYLGDLVAIGEFGIDATLPLTLSFQQRVFIDQLGLAQSVSKPVILHHRQSHNELIRLIKKCNFQQGGVIHAFSGSAQIAQSYIDLGFKLGVGGTITYPRGEKTRKALTKVPLSALLLETDAPDMPIYGFQGMRNTPERLGIVAESLAELKQVSVEEIVNCTTANYMSLFSSMSAP